MAKRCSPAGIAKRSDGWGNPQHPFIPEADRAFTADGEPIASIHELYAPAVRKIVSPAFYAHVMLLKAPMEDWLASMAPNPDGGEPLSALQLRYQRKEDGDDPITPEHWESAWWQGDIAKDEQESSSSYVPAMADRLLQMMQSGTVPSFARSFYGGPISHLEPNMWEIDSALDRLAMCALDPDRPFDQSAPPTHWIFVDEPAFRAALSGIQAVALTWDDDEEAVDDTDTGNVVAHPSRAGAIRECAGWLIEQFDDPSTSRMLKTQFKEEALRKFAGRLAGRGFETAWQGATEQRPERSKPGRRADD